MKNKSVKYFFKRNALWLAMLVACGAISPLQAQQNNAKVIEAEKAEAANTETANTETANTETANTETANTETIIDNPDSLEADTSENSQVLDNIDDLESDPDLTVDDLETMPIAQDDASISNCKTDDDNTHNEGCDNIGDQAIPQKNTDDKHVSVSSDNLDDSVKCSDGKVCIEASTGLPLQILPRSFTNMYKEQSAQKDGIIMANVTAFRPLYVFSRNGVDFSDPANPTGWYQVGLNDKQPKGWMQAKDVMEWKQALVVAYTHPGDEIEGRKPVLMFKGLKALHDIIEADDMVAEADKLYQQIEDKVVPDAIVSKEPKRYVNINEQLYLLPILDWKTEEVEGQDVRLLQIAAAVPNARGADTIDNAEYVENANAGRSDTQGADIGNMKVDMVYVIDTTRSMQPFIDATREMVEKIAEHVSSNYKGDVKFGVVGFRDDNKATPKIEYAAKNFTPELVDASVLADLLSSDVKATKTGSRDYAEDVFAGVNEAIKSGWREGALRFVVLIGDASSHPMGHEKNTSGKDDEALVKDLAINDIRLMSVHLANPKAQKDHELAKQQFAKLAIIPGKDNAALFEVDTSKSDAFDEVAKEIGDQFIGQYDSYRGDADDNKPAPEAETKSEGNDIITDVWQSALIDYIGRSAKPPKDITAWVADKDLTNLDDQSLQVRVLITKEQLSNLTESLDRILRALRESSLSQSQFFDALQSISGQTLKRPEDIGKAQKLADTGLLPSFINSLPYKSDILSLTNDEFASMTTEQRASLEQNLQAKLIQYLEINENTGVWHKLNKDDPESIVVHPLLIDYLP